MEILRQRGGQPLPVTRALVADAMHQHHGRRIPPPGGIDMHLAVEDRFLHHGLGNTRHGGQKCRGSFFAGRRGVCHQRHRQAAPQRNQSGTALCESLQPAHDLDLLMEHYFCRRAFPESRRFESSRARRLFITGGVSPCRRRSLRRHGAPPPQYHDGSNGCRPATR